jgi:ribosomal-protein-serine acetyltransferase
VPAEADRVELVDVVSPDDAEPSERLGERPAGVRQRFTLGQGQRAEDDLPAVPHLCALLAAAAEVLGLDVGDRPVGRAGRQRAVQTRGSVLEPVRFEGSGNGEGLDEGLGHRHQRQPLTQWHDPRLDDPAGHRAEHGFAADDRFQVVHVLIFVGAGRRVRGTIISVEHPAEVLANDHLRLRRCRRSDTDAMYRLVTESQTHLRPWMPWAAGTYDRAAATAFLALCDSGWTSGEMYCYLIMTGDLAVGVCALHRTIGAGGFEIGYWLHPEHTGRGLAAEATSLLVEHVFTLPDVRRVQIWHDAANTASAAIPRRLGFTEVARRTPPREPVTSGETGVDVIWQLTRPPVS